MGAKSRVSSRDTQGLHWWQRYDRSGWLMCSIRTCAESIIRMELRSKGYTSPNCYRWVVLAALGLCYSADIFAQSVETTKLESVPSAGQPAADAEFPPELVT